MFPSLLVCGVCRDAEGTSEERTSSAGGSLLCPEHHGGGQATPDKGKKKVEQNCNFWSLMGVSPYSSTLQYLFHVYLHRYPITICTIEHLERLITPTAVCCRSFLPLLSSGDRGQKKTVRQCAVTRP